MHLALVEVTQIGFSLNYVSIFICYKRQLHIFIGLFSEHDIFRQSHMSFCDGGKSQQYFAGMQTIQRSFDISLPILSRNDYLRRLQKVPFHVRELGEILHFQRLQAAKHN